MVFFSISCSSPASLLYLTFFPLPFQSPPLYLHRIQLWKKIDHWLYGKSKTIFLIKDCSDIMTNNDILLCP